MPITPRVRHCWRVTRYTRPIPRLGSRTVRTWFIGLLLPPGNAGIGANLGQTKSSSWDLLRCKDCIFYLLSSAIGMSREHSHRSCSLYLVLWLFSWTIDSEGIKKTLGVKGRFRRQSCHIYDRPWFHLSENQINSRSYSRIYPCCTVRKRIGTPESNHLHICSPRLFQDMANTSRILASSFVFLTAYKDEKSTQMYFEKHSHILVYST